MASVRYGTSHFHKFSLYKFPINLIKSVFWITFGQESWGGGEAVFLKKKKKKKKAGSGARLDNVPQKSL
jgi:hypothetical protein